MSSTELEDLESVAVRLLADPSAFAQRLLEQLLDRLATAPGQAPRQRPVTVEGTVADSTEQELLDRQILLAAALGACECWGSDPECPFCGGDGLPAWRHPDPQLYEEFVAPATARLAESARPPHRREGTSDEHDLAGEH